MKTIALPTLLLAAGASLAACGEADAPALDAQTAALAANTNFRQVAVELARAARFVAESGLLAEAALAGCEEEPPAGEEPSPCEPPDLDLADEAEALADFLAEKVFVEANVESADGDTVTFLLRPEVVCGADASCFESLGELPIRLAVTSDAPGDVDVALLVGASRLNPLDLLLHRDALEVQADLRALRAVLLELGGEAPAAMEGRVHLALVRHGPEDFTASVSVPEAVRIEGTSASPFALELAEAMPAFAARVRADRNELELAFGLSRTELRVPVDALEADDCAGAACSEALALPLEGTYGLRLGGLTGRTVLSVGETERLVVEGFGLGSEPSRLDLDGASLVELELDGGAPAGLDLALTSEATGLLLEASPGLRLRLALDLANAAETFEVADWALEEELVISLSGDEPAVRLPEAADGRIEVVRGTLRLESELLAAVEVDAPLCLVQAEPDASWPDHPFSGLAAGACAP